MSLTWILLFCLLVSVHETKRSPNDLNVSKEPPNPVLFWPMTSVKHDTAYHHNHRYAFLENTGPPTLSVLSGTGMDVASFGIAEPKYILISSLADLGYTGFIDAISVSFNIYFTDITQNTVLAQFLDATGNITVELRLEGIMLMARWLDIDRIEYVGELNIKNGNWILVGFQFNMKWTSDEQIDLYYIDSKGSNAAAFGMGKRTITLPEMDKIVIGGDYFGGSTFSGEIGCVQIYGTSILGGTRADSYDLCDPSKMDPDFGDYTIELPIFIPTTEVISTEQTTNEQTTAEDLSTNFSTGLTTNGLVTMVTTNDLVTTVTTSSMTSTAGIFSSNVYTPIIDNCYHMRTMETDRAIASPLTILQVPSLERCASSCYQHPNCVVFSMSSFGSGECRISDNIATTFMAGYVVYSI